MRQFGTFLHCSCGVLMLAACFPASPDCDFSLMGEGSIRIAVGDVVQEIYWSDGDSGRIDGTRFRLADIDAPETGGVGARGGAKCEGERELGFAAKEAIVEMTRPRGRSLVVTRV